MPSLATLDFWCASPPSATRHLVLRIVVMGSKLQMSGVTARRVVALVSNNKAVRDRPVGQFKRNPMGLERVLLTQCHLPISETISSPGVWPTFIECAVDYVLVNFLGQWDCPRCHN